MSRTIEQKYINEDYYTKWSPKVPYLKLKEGWEISIIPPFGGAASRFRIRKNSIEVSIYLDCDNSLGFFDGPYWEVYPVNGGDVERVGMLNTEGLIELIEKSIEEREGS